MIRALPQRSDAVPAVRRIMALASLDMPAMAALAESLARSRVARRGRNLATEGAPVGEPLLILSGWAACVRIFENGRLQILSFLLPGELVGNCVHPRAVFSSTVVALTDVTFCAAPSRRVSQSLGEAYAVSQAIEEAHLLANIARLGRLSAQERLVDLLLELAERLDLCGLADGGRFEIPVTQQILADATGLTVVHVNRMIGQLRRQNDICWNERTMTLLDISSLARKVGRSPTRVQMRPS